MSETAETRAAAGAALLDDQRPGWWRAINVAELDMSDGHHDVLGQLYGDFIRGMNALDLNAIGNEGALLRDSVDLGFDLGFDLDYLTIAPGDRLTAAWRAEIAKRREKGCA